MALPEINDISEKVKHWQSDETRYFRSLPVKNYIFSVIALLGMVFTCLTWADVTVGFYNKAMAIGLHFFLGWLAFLTFLGVFCIMLFNKHLKVREAFAEKVPLYGAVVTCMLTVIFIIGKLFHVRYGVYLCFADSLAFLYFVWHFNYKNKVRNQ